MVVLDLDGNVTDLWQYLARDERGERLVALYYPQSGRELVALLKSEHGLGHGQAMPKGLRPAVSRRSGRRQRG